MDAIGKSGSPMFAYVGEIRMRETKPMTMQGMSSDPLTLRLDLQRHSFYTDTRALGNGPAMPQISFEDAVRRLVI